MNVPRLLPLRRPLLLGAAIATGLLALVPWQRTDEPGTRPVADAAAPLASRDSHPAAHSARDETRASGPPPRTSLPEGEHDGEGALLRKSAVDRAHAEPSAAFVRAQLREAIETHLPRLALSDIELDALADATLRLRGAQGALRATPKDLDNRERRQAARARLREATEDFSYITGLRPGEFARRVQPDAGIDREWGEDAASEPVFRPLRSADAP